MDAPAVTFLHRVPPLLLAAAAALMAVAALCAPAPAAAASGASHGFLRVSAQVVPYARLELHASPQAIAVTAGDIDRGYLDVAQPMSFSVSTNMLHGARVSFVPAADFVEQIVVTGLGSPVVLGRQGGSAALPDEGTGLRRTAVNLRFRLFLGKATVPGTYPWPVRVATDVL